MAYENYQQVTGVITEINRGNSCCSQMVSVRTNSEVINFIVSADNTLRLNISPMTNILTVNGQRFTCSPRNMELLVYYTTSTFSIPAQTTPQKIIVMCTGE